MKKVVVIGLNDFGMEIARQITRSGAMVTAIDSNKSRTIKISPDVRHALHLNILEISKLKKVKFETYDAIVMIMAEDINLSLGILILFKSLTIKNVIVCAENDDQEMVAKEFQSSNNWLIVRLDKQVGHYMKSLIDELEEKNKL